MAEAKPLRYNLTMTEGHTKSFVIRWSTEPIVRKAIVSITAPTGCARINVPGHGLKDGWSVAVTNSKGITKINADLEDLANPDKRFSQMHQATVIDQDTIELNKLNIADWGTHTANTGFVEYDTPVDITNHTQVLRLRDKEGGRLLVCTQAGTTGTTKPTAAGADGSVVWAAGSPAAVEKVWVAGTAYSLGDVVDVSILASSDVADTPLDVLLVTPDPANYSIQVTFPPIATTLLSGKTGYYCLEDSSADTVPVVTRLAYGTLKVDKE